MTSIKKITTLKRLAIHHTPYKRLMIALHELINGVDCPYEISFTLAAKQNRVCSSASLLDSLGQADDPNADDFEDFNVFMVLRYTRCRVKLLARLGLMSQAGCL